MKEYHKIQTIFKRDLKGKIMEGEYSIPEFEYLKNNEWVFTEKVDGTNIRVMFDGNQLTFGGKTDNAQIPAFLVKHLQEKFLPQIDKFKEIFADGTLPANMCLYGEGYGAKIQKGGGNYRPDQGFVLFDIKISDWWLKRVDIEEIAERLQTEVVPVIGTGSLHYMIDKVKNGIKSIWGDFKAEGIVARPAVELKTRSGQRIITKLKHRDFQG